MKLSLDRVLKWTWLVIGVLLLGSLLAALVFVAAGFLRTRGATDAAEEVVAEGVEPRERRGVRLTLPRDVRGTETRVAFVVREGGAGGRLAEPGRVQGVENVVFVDPDGSARLLLDRAAEIREVRFPAPGDAGEEAAAWITYEIAGGRGAALYVSGVDGRGLRAVVEPPLRYVAHRAFGAGRILVYAAEDGVPQRAFLYDVVSGSVVPFAALDSVAARARGGVER